MHLADPTRLLASVNADPEFRLAGPLLECDAQPRIALARAPGRDRGRPGRDLPGERCRPAGHDHGGRLRRRLGPVSRPDAAALLPGSARRLRATPRVPGGGDILSLSAYYQASTRLFAVMRALRAASEEAS